jgi:high-affinity iron transporter
MLPTFVIGLREGLEAALIVGIIAAFLRKQGRKDLLRWVLLGVATAIVLCTGIGVALDLVSQNLPQRQQEGLETVIGVLAVGMVTYMVVWMRRHSRELKGQLEDLAADAMGTNRRRAGFAMVLMAFLAVLREGIETVVFLLAAFNESASGASAPAGAVLGVLVAIGLGYGIYRGGLRINLSKFFRATGIVLVLVAGGLVVNALHTAHEAGWLDAGQSSTVDLTWLAKPGSVQSSLLTGMLGIQPRPVLVEIVGWLVYIVPVGLYVAWPPGRALARRTLSRVLLASGAAATAATVTCVLFVPSRPASTPVTIAGAISAQLLSRSGNEAVVRTQVQSPGGSGIGALRDIPVVRTSSERRGGVQLDMFTARIAGDAAGALPGELSYDAVARANGGRLPIGLRPTDAVARVGYDERTILSVAIATSTGRVVRLDWHETVRATVLLPAGGSIALSTPVIDRSSSLPQQAATAAVEHARAEAARADDRERFGALAWTFGTGALLLLAAGAVLHLHAIRARRGGAATSSAAGTPAGELLRS